MDHHLADARVAALQRDVLGGRGDEFARDRVAAVVVRHHRHGIAGLQPVRLAWIGARGFRARCRFRDIEGVFP